MKSKAKIGIAPALSGLGGMVSFQAKFLGALERRQVQHSFDLDDAGLSAALLIGGPRSGLPLRGRQDLRVVQRLDGINWLHRKLPTGAKHWLRAEIGNALLRRVRERVADAVIYQSHFVQEWWHKSRGSKGEEHVVHNGVDLEHFHPSKGKRKEGKDIKLLMVEGHLEGGYEIGLLSAIQLLNELSQRHKEAVQLSVAGMVDKAVRQKAERQAQGAIEWLGVIENGRLPEHYRRADMLFSGDLNAACPNAVIEALACGLPVVAFKTGALAELVSESAGQLADYGGDPWNLDPPDIAGLAEAALAVKADNKGYREGARARAEEAFDLEQMMDRYLEVLLADGD